MFHGNASLALDCLYLLDPVPDRTAGYLMIDYPGYGECAGNPTPEVILDSSEKAMAALAEKLKADPKALFGHLNVFGYSLGASAALQLAARHPVERVVLIAPFTSLPDMARRVVGWPMCLLLRHRFDNRTRLAELARQPTRPGVTIFHGDRDGVVPVQMGRELAAMVPGWIQYHEILGADHIDVLNDAGAMIQKAMSQK